jgi:hypothetical protein
LIYLALHTYHMTFDLYLTAGGARHSHSFLLTLSHVFKVWIFFKKGIGVIGCINVCSQVLVIFCWKFEPNSSQSNSIGLNEHRLI